MKQVAGLAKKITNILRSALHSAPAIKDGLSNRATNTKKSVLSARRSVIGVFKRPLSDISHLSLVLVIALALLSGFSTVSIGEVSISTNPFSPTQQPINQYVSAAQKRALEADSVATVAGWHSNKLGQDAAEVADKINSELSTTEATLTTVNAVPMAAVDMTVSGASTKVQDYVVQNGDTLSTIASKFNISTDTVRYANGIENIDDIQPGQTLTILPVTGVLHTVKTGETLAGIASRYLVTEAIIVSSNDLYGLDITEGMKLIIPGGEIPEAPKPKPVVTEQKSQGSRGSSSSIGSTGNFMFPTVNSGGYYNGYHSWAIDIQGGVGTPIYASDSGRIVEARYGYNGGYGNTILIDHGNGYQTRYAHMSSLEIIDGYVSKGQVIGYMGSTGRSTGSHLHFEIISGGTRLNPCRFLGGCSG